MTELAHRRPQSVAEHATVDYTAALQHLGLRASDPKAHALILVCQRYQLDPLLGHVSIYKDRPYIHFAGYLHIANDHPCFAGIETVREWDDERYCYATVRVHRSDRDFPSERTGKSLKAKPKQGGGTYADDDADAKAFAQACRRALRMAFNVDHPDPAEDEGAGPTPAPAPVVEVARRIDQTSEMARGGSAPPPAPGPTSEAGGYRTNNLPASDPNASATGPGDTGVSSGHEPPNAEASTYRRGQAVESEHGTASGAGTSPVTGANAWGEGVRPDSGRSSVNREASSPRGRETGTAAPQGSAVSRHGLATEVGDVELPGRGHSAPDAESGAGDRSSSRLPLPTSPGDGKAGRGHSRRGGSGNAPAASELPPAEPDEQAEQAEFDAQLAGDDTGKWTR